MVTLEIWYDQADGEATIVRTSAELDALVERVRRETDLPEGGAAIQVAIDGDEDSPVLEVGLGRSK
ncbi:hypothetical protein [Alloactinosynnema sp. L-07]|uniref:Imm1 family immunity protein n=1 Tax=Alloactinosynnema sp. L-07 TaxID=1653480 RepID=UPI00065F04F5|nr:Imm1 family immunity protein [Alloactinosynnema sp. L-07]CRK61299.1 hypothetical protein [Alloactinosynnema sp. L-07]